MAAPMFTSLFRGLVPLRNILISLKPLKNLNDTCRRGFAGVHTSLKESLRRDYSDVDEKEITKETISKVNELVKRGEHGRLFAVVHICGKQFKITPEDIIIIEGYWPPQNGDQIKLEKVMLAGGKDFTLIGRPILPQDMVTVRATVIEKDLSHTKTMFYKRRRKQYMRTHFYRSQQTMLRINEISITGEVNNHNKIESYDRIIV